MSINNIKRVLLSLVIGLCAGSVMAAKERVAFAPHQPRPGSVVARPLTRESLKPVATNKSKPASSQEKKERKSFGSGPQQVRKGQ
jgi:hypothetical protein